MMGDYLAGQLEQEILQAVEEVLRERMSNE